MKRERRKSVCESVTLTLTMNRTSCCILFFHSTFSPSLELAFSFLSLISFPLSLISSTLSLSHFFSSLEFFLPQNPTEHLFRSSPLFLSSFQVVSSKVSRVNRKVSRQREMRESERERERESEQERRSRQKVGSGSFLSTPSSLSQKPHLAFYFFFFPLRLKERERERKKIE